MNIPWTTVAAVTGAVLGIYNSLQNLWHRRVRMKVIPKLTAIRQGTFLSNSVDLIHDGFACIEVRNLSAFSVTVREVGFSLDGKQKRAVIIPEPATLLPKRLEPRESIDILGIRSGAFPLKALRAYATTQCGHTSYGDSPVLAKWRKMYPA